MSRLRLSSLAVAVIYGAIMVPLMTRVGPFTITTWMIPTIALVIYGLYLPKFSLSNQLPWNSWAFAVVGLSLWLVLVTNLNPPNRFINNYKFLAMYVGCLVFGLFVYRTAGKVFTVDNITNFAAVGIVIQFVVGMIQYRSGTPWGHLASYLGDQREADLHGTTLGMEQVFRIVGTLGAPNVVGHFIAMLLPFVVYRMFVTERTWIRYLMIGVVACGALTVVIAQSRAAITLIGLYFVVVAIWWLTPASRSVRRRWLRSGFVFVVAGGVAVVTWIGLRRGLLNAELMDSLQALRLRFEELLNIRQSYSLDVRGTLNAAAWDMFWEHPFVGVGYMNTVGIAFEASIALPASMPDSMRVHNVYIQMLAEGGLLAGVLYVYVSVYPLYRVVFRSDGNRHLRFAFASSLAIGIVFSLGSTTFNSPALAPIYALIWGVACAYSIRDEEAGGERGRTD